MDRSIRMLLLGVIVALPSLAFAQESGDLPKAAQNPVAAMASSTATWTTGWSSRSNERRR